MEADANAKVPMLGKGGGGTHTAHGGNGVQTTVRMSQPPQSFLATVLYSMKENALLVFTILGVILGILLGCLMRYGNFSDPTKALISFPGEILMRMLKMLILPLIVSSLIAGLAQLDAKVSHQLVTQCLDTHFSRFSMLFRNQTRRSLNNNIEYSVAVY
ncbi:excitatory amino acid transporter 2-like protein [Leptotrombidium deliense]|uniref:Amino acid transporter n=1 Tax=Leptotrombidium deliense TaxID=299467 RepID=A0A443SKB0_9ACAR|nr:excitatory amino acid transporter 2-like protein [Leptotrombidium deliense]